MEFIFDFASPNAYLSYRALPALCQRTGLTVEITPCLLGGIFKATNNQAPMMTYANVTGKLAYQRLEIERFIARHGLTAFRFNPHFPVNTLVLMRAAMVALDREELDRYVDVMLVAMWEDGKKMDDPAVIAEVLGANDFDAKTYLEMAQSQPIKDALAKNTNEAVQRGVFGIPTFFIGDDMWFGKERLDDIERYLTNRPT